MTIDAALLRLLRSHQDRNRGAPVPDHISPPVLLRPWHGGHHGSTARQIIANSYRGPIRQLLLIALSKSSLWNVACRRRGLPKSQRARCSVRPGQQQMTLEFTSCGRLGEMLSRRFHPPSQPAAAPVLSASAGADALTAKEASGGRGPASLIRRASREPADDGGSGLAGSRRRPRVKLPSAKQLPDINAA